MNEYEELKKRIEKAKKEIIDEHINNQYVDTQFCAGLSRALQILDRCLQEEDKTDRSLSEIMDEKYANREDKDNIFGVGLTDREFIDFVIKYLLGDDWCVADPLGQTQINEIALYEILGKYSKEYIRERKRIEKGNLRKKIAKKNKTEDKNENDTGVD